MCKVVSRSWFSFAQVSVHALSRYDRQGTDVTTVTSTFIPWERQLRSCVWEGHRFQAREGADSEHWLGVLNMPSKGHCACVVCNRPLCRAQLREPRKQDFFFFPFLFCVAEDKQLGPQVKGFSLLTCCTLEIPLLPPSKEICFSCCC